MENAEWIEILKNEPFGIFHAKHFHSKILISEDFEDGMLSDIIRVHDANYVLHIWQVCSEIKEGNILQYDGDTSLTCESWPAAIRAVGAVVEACWAVLHKEYKNAFCPVWPPGHHAGIYGTVDISTKELK